MFECFLSQLRISVSKCEFGHRAVHCTHEQMFAYGFYSPSPLAYYGFCVAVFLYKISAIFLWIPQLQKIQENSQTPRQCSYQPNAESAPKKPTRRIRVECSDCVITFFYENHPPTRHIKFKRIDYITYNKSIKANKLLSTNLERFLRRIKYPLTRY